jgi:hypothetical protein
MALLAACGGKPAVPTAAAEAPAAPDQPASLTLTAADQGRLGLVKARAQALQYTPEAQGYGLVLGHEAIAQTSAELTIARAASSASSAALARSERLKSTQGALTAESEEAVRRQAGADAAALLLAEQRLTAQFGEQPSWSGHASSALLAELAAGKLKLLRATFPYAALGPKAPTTLRFARLDASAEPRPWNSSIVWPAPADSSMPGRSYFAALAVAELAEGERLSASATAGAAQAGVLVPAAALVFSAGQSWCYLEQPAGTFLRKAVDLARPVPGGYFVQGSLAPGDTLVTSGAGLLLARETHTGGEAE